MPLAGLSLRDLEYLVAVGEHRHFGRAAAACAVSQPALSGQIRKTEELLRVTLSDPQICERFTTFGFEPMRRHPARSRRHGMTTCVATATSSRARRSRSNHYSSRGQLRPLFGV